MDIKKQFIIRLIISLKKRLFNSREDIQKYRLSPTELNMLVGKMVARLNGNTSNLPLGSFYSFCHQNNKFFICPMHKDDGNINNENYIDFILDGIKRFCETQKERDCVILMPVFLCRGFIKAPIHLTFLNHEIFKWFKRKHGVLLEINLIENVIRMHDSQDALLHYFYPDKINEIIHKMSEMFGRSLTYDTNQHYHAYDIQDDDFSCGYFVLAYLECILRMGHSKECKQVGINEKGEKIGLKIKETYKNKYQFAQEKYDVTFYGMLPQDSEIFADEFGSEIENIIKELENEMIDLETGWWDMHSNAYVPSLHTSNSSVIKHPNLLIDLSIFNEVKKEKQYEEQDTIVKALISTPISPVTKIY